MFNKYYMCHFGADVQISSVPSENLQRIWQCEWSCADVQKIWHKWLQKPNVPEAESTSEEAEVLLCDAIQLILTFVQHNFCGPNVHIKEFNKMLQELSLSADYDPFVKLSANGEEVNSNVKLGELLVLAELLLGKLLQQWPQDLYLNWWNLRVVCIKQQILDDLANDLYEQFKSTAARLKPLFEQLHDNEEYSLLTLEMANGFLLFQRTQKCEELLDGLCQYLQVSLEVKGLLGLRTKFQQKALPQLCLKVQQQQQTLPELPSALQTHGSTILPKLLQLDDDTRLERIRFIEPSDNESMTIASVLQILVLSKVKLLQRTQPKDRLRDEEIEPYLQTLMYQENGALQVRTTALIMNCSQESTQRRTVERSWKQCTDVVKWFSDSTGPTLRERLSYAFAAFLQPHWHVQLLLCDILLSLGLTKTALDIYLSLEAWPQVIECYNRLELHHKAAEIIRSQLAIKPTVLLHCLLGDATEDPKCYEQAWNFSKQRSGKAQAYWGNYHFRRNEFALALPHLRLSVEINALQENIWQRLGYAALMIEDWQLAVQAYLTYTHLEPYGFQAWNNLAKALIKLGDKQRAHKVLMESIKCNYNNWKVWENVMLVSLDTGHLEDTLNAYLRLIELKQRFLDLEVLELVIKAIVDDKPDAKGQTKERLLKTAVKLIDKQCVQHVNEPRVWELAALLEPTPIKKSQALMRAYRAHVGIDPTWSSKQDMALKALKFCLEFCEHSLAAAEKAEGAQIPQVNSVRITAQGALHAVEMNGSADWAENQAVVQKLQQLLEKMKPSQQEK